MASPRAAAQGLNIADAAKRLGISIEALRTEARAWLLEPNFSVSETAAHFGCSEVAVHRLVAYGRQFGRNLHPTRGGLWPTFKPLHKGRRIPLSAIERHLAFMEHRDVA